MSVVLDLEYLNSRDWWSRVDVGLPDECWPWKLSIGSHGYGQTWDGKSVTTAHRVAWVLANGRQVPAGLVIDHMCHNRVCCNPAHLRPLDAATNAWLQARSFKTHCVHGHEYTPFNTYVDPSGGRRCRICAKARRRREHLKQAAEAGRV